MERIKPDLRVLLIEITQKCNAKCDHCGSRCDMDSPEALSREDFVRLFTDVRDNIGTDCMINISGGEPLMRRDLFDIMAIAHDMGFDWGMVSNGVLITDDVIAKMKETGMRTITVSIDGLKETHEQLRHLPGSFDRIISNLKKLKEADFLDTIQVTFTSNKRNIGEFPALYEILDKIGLDSIRTSCIDPIGRAEDNPELLPDRKDLKTIIRFANEINKSNRTPIEWGCPHFYDGRIEGRTFYCFAGVLAASILYNGDIFVCPNVPRRKELIQGNIKTDSFSKVWKEGFKWFRERDLWEFCRDCKYRDRCNGDSLHTYDFENKRPKFCYREIFDIKSNKYKQYLKQRYGNYRIESVDSDEPADNIYIEPSAYDDLRHIFHMGRKDPRSMFEQQVGLVGFMVDGDYVIKYVFPSVTRAMAADLAVYTADTLTQAERETKIYLRNFDKSQDCNDYTGSGLRFLGFAHSHPAQKDLCYSIGDEILHKKMIKRYGNYIGILINPTEDTIGAYYGFPIRQGNLKIIIQEDRL